MLVLACTTTSTIHDVACPDCGGKLRLLAAITDRKVIEKIPRHLNLSVDLPAPAPARQAEWWGVHRRGAADQSDDAAG